MLGDAKGCIAGPALAHWYIEIQRRPKKHGVAQFRLCSKHGDRLINKTHKDDLLVVEEINRDSSDESCPERPGAPDDPDCW